MIYENDQCTSEIYDDIKCKVKIELHSPVAEPLLDPYSSGLSLSGFCCIGIRSDARDCNFLISSSFCLDSSIVKAFSYRLIGILKLKTK